MRNETRTPVATSAPTPNAGVAQFILDRCPTAREIAEIDARLSLVFEADSTEGSLACTSAAGSADLTLYKQRIYQVALLARAVRFTRPLPWTDKTLWEWLTSAIRGIRFRGDISPSGSCCDPARVINIYARNSVLSDLPYHYGMFLEIALWVHEARHSERPAHTCGALDQTIDELGAWAVHYYLLSYLESYVAPPEFLSTEARSILGGYAKEIRDNNFCALRATATVTATATPPTDPIGGAAVLAEDSFTRFSTGWGAAEVGGLWSHDFTYGSDATGSASVDGQRGNLTFTMGSGPFMVVCAVGPGSSGDYDVAATVRVSQAAGAQVMVVGRVVDATHFYAAGIYPGQNSFTMSKYVNGVPTVLGAAAGPTPAFQANRLYKIRFQLRGTTLRARWWPAGNPEPGSWAVTVLDSTHVTGQIGVASALDQNAPQPTGYYLFDDFVAVPLP